ncbi:MAG: N-acyl-D-aspartate/D-glutamate deacylase [Myxococcota bacterium]|jgi:N-acyl-D-aspartate/D-glutamate deacylase
MSRFDLIISGGTVFDGTGGDGRVCDVGIKDGVVTAIETDLVDADRVIDATGRWITPGFVDIHTHYDAELLMAPGLGESVRHGVTTVMVGSCSISTVHGSPTDSADMFARVEALPYDYVKGAMTTHKQWSDAQGWAEHVDQLPLGPNVVSMIGHSDIRAKVMGLGRSVDPRARPSDDEMKQMEALLEQALEAGFVGMSSMTNPWDKLDGERYRSSALPSTYATWKEYSRLHHVLRRWGRILQSAPNLNTKVNILAFFATSGSWLFRRTLKTSLIAAADPKASEWLAPGLGLITRAINRVIGACLRWQAVPAPFDIYADGIDLVVFEEFGAGEAALHISDEIERNKLMASEAYRRRFRKDYEKRFTPRVWHRDLHDADILACPDENLVGKTVGQVADERGIHPADCFLDLVVAYGTKLRWKTLIANHRPHILHRMLRDPSVQVGFSDSGAHLRNMAFYNYAVRFLRSAKESPETLMPMGQAVRKVTGELADWWGLDAGCIAQGRRADLVVIDPEALDGRVDSYHEAPMAGAESLPRMVRRNDETVTHTIIAGKVAWEDGQFASGFGTTEQFGRFLPVSA